MRAMTEGLDNIRNARGEVLAWLTIHDRNADMPADATALTSEWLVERFLANIRIEGFSFGAAMADNKFIVRWSHPTVSVAKIIDPLPVPDLNDAQLLACASLLREVECFQALIRV
jgi:hypothetical protein